MTNLRQLDALIAEHVFGWTEIVWQAGDECFDGRWAGVCDWIPDYSTDIALAIGVLEKLRGDGITWWAIDSGVKDLQEKEAWGIQLRVNKGSRFHPKWYECPLPEAICRHVVHVLGLEKP